MSTSKDGAAYRETRWSAGQRSLLRFLEREGTLTAEPEAPSAGDAVGNAAFFHALSGSIGAADLAALLAARLRLVVVDLDAQPIDAAVVALLPETVAIECEVVPTGAAEGAIDLAMANPLDLSAVKQAEQASGRRAHLFVATHDAIRRALARHYGAAPEPVTDAPAAPAPERRAEPAVPPPARPPCVLIVDPDLGRRMRARSAVERAGCGCVVVTARDAAEAFAITTLEPPDLVVVDVANPATGGERLCRELGASGRTAGVRVVPLAGAEPEEAAGALLTALQMLGGRPPAAESANARS